MKTFGCGSRVIPTSSINEVGMSIINYLEEMHRKMEHGHIFGYNRKCTYGLLQKDYLLDKPTEICKDYEKK